MSISLICYSTKTSGEVAKIMDEVKNQHSDLFSEKFFMCPVLDATKLAKEVALQYNFHASSLFEICYIVKSSLYEPKVVEIVKQALGHANVLLLYENETLM